MNTTKLFNTIVKDQIYTKYAYPTLFKDLE